MSISSYFKQRFTRIFNYTSHKWYYVLAKTLCIIVGLPLYVVLIPAEFVVFFLYAVTSWVPFLGIFMLFVTKVLSMVLSVGYYIAILPNLKQYIKEDTEQEKKAKELEQNDGVEIICQTLTDDQPDEQGEDN